MKESYFEKIIREKLHFLYPSEHIAVDIRKGVVIGVVAVVVGMLLIGLVLSIKENKSKSITLESFKCPKEYDTREEYLESIDKFADYLLEVSPEITTEEGIIKRGEWFASEGCEEGNWSTDTQNSKTALNSGEIPSLYFFSYGIASTTENCPQVESIDWELAIIAMSDYWQYGAGSTSDVANQEPAEIQRSFNLHCERNMTIYNEMIKRNPHLLKRENKTEYP